MSLGIITYQGSHRKTIEVLERLVEQEGKITVYALPFIMREKRQVLFEHRPYQNKGESTKEYSINKGLEYRECLADTDIDDNCDIYLITGAGILSKECVRGKRILNCHPGIIPAVRGLDAFKWAILEKQPVGNTLHFIDQEVDQGEVVAIEPTPLYAGDTIDDFAQRHYKYEIDMLIQYKYYLTHPKNNFKELSMMNAHRRMNAETEKKMLDSFEEYKKMYAAP